MYADQKTQIAPYNPPTFIKYWRIYSLPRPHRNYSPPKFSKGDELPEFTTNTLSILLQVYLVYLYVVSLVGIVCLELYLNRLHAQERTGQLATDAGVDPNPEHKLGFSNLGFKTDFSLSPNGRTNSLGRQASYTSESDLRIRESDQGDEEHSPHRTSIYTRIGAVSKCRSGRIVTIERNIT